MPFTIAEEKARLRRETRAFLSQLSPQARRARDEALFQVFLSLPELRAAETVFLFHGIPGREPDTARLFPLLAAMGKRIALPRMTPGYTLTLHYHDPAVPLHPTSFGLLEPDPALPTVAPSQIQLALIPALRYDRRGFRLGYGGGYYDRWLSDYQGLSVGLCPKALLLSTLPRSPYDLPVSLVLTEDGPLPKA